MIRKRSDSDVKGYYSEADYSASEHSGKENTQEEIKLQTK